MRPVAYRGWSRGAETPARPRPPIEEVPAPEGVPVHVPDLSRLIPASAVYTGRTPVVTAGVRVQLPDIPARSVSILALAGNAGEVYLGDVTVNATIGFPLAAGDGVDLAIDNLRRLYLDAANNGDAIAFLVIR
jgi:hypothetical protein